MSARRVPDSGLVAPESVCLSQTSHRDGRITDDFARWDSCGIPSIWHSPTTRQPGGNPRRNRHMRDPGFAPGCRVVALTAVLVAGHPGDLPQCEARAPQIAKISWAIKQAVGLAVDPLAFTALTRLLPARACDARPAQPARRRPDRSAGANSSKPPTKDHRVAESA
jgi:hypothetical protein